MFTHIIYNETEVMFPMCLLCLDAWLLGNNGVAAEAVVAIGAVKRERLTKHILVLSRSAY